MTHGQGILSPEYSHWKRRKRSTHRSQKVKCNWFPACRTRETSAPPNAENMFHAQPIPDCQTPAQKKLYWCAWNTEKKETPLTPCELSLCLPKEKKKEKKIEYGPLILSLILNSSSNTFANGQSTENALGQFLAIL